MYFLFAFSIPLPRQAGHLSAARFVGWRATFTRIIACEVFLFLDLIVSPCPANYDLTRTILYKHPVWLLDRTKICSCHPAAGGLIMASISALFEAIAFVMPVYLARFTTRLHFGHFHFLNPHVGAYGTSSSWNPHSQVTSIIYLSPICKILSVV